MKRKQSFEWLLKEYMARNHIDTMAELASLIGMTRKTLYDRIANPNTLRVFELMSIDEVLHFSDEDMARLGRGQICGKK